MIVKGKEAADISKFGNNAKWEGNRMWVEGKFGTAVKFKHNPEQPGLLRTPEDEIFAFEGYAQITLMAWVNVDAARPGMRTIVYNCPNIGDANYGLGLKAVDFNFFYKDVKGQGFSSYHIDMGPRKVK